MVFNHHGVDNPDDNTQILTVAPGMNGIALRELTAPSAGIDSYRAQYFIGGKLAESDDVEKGV
jgi:hypothetical protein